MFYAPFHIPGMELSLPGVGGVEPREFEDFEFNRLSMLEAELVLL